ncbi:Protein SRT-40 [Aphelenchoides avenae]|nr:Protein SRT-40 [Aphelenchus avenae]
MELLLFRHDEFRRLYNCSYDVDYVPIEQRTHPVIGVALILATLVYEVAYVPCMFVFWRHMRYSSCYKIMFYLGVVDIINMVFVGGFTGICAIWGLVYCSAPAIMYFVGTVAPRTPVQEKTAL